jgi:hypothetical protein
MDRWPRNASCAETIPRASRKNDRARTAGSWRAGSASRRFRARARHQGTSERLEARSAPESLRHPARDWPINGAIQSMHGSAADLGQVDLEEIGADRGCGMDAEQRRQDRRHQRTAADAGKADEAAEREPGQRIERVEAMKNFVPRPPSCNPNSIIPQRLRRPRRRPEPGRDRPECRRYARSRPTALRSRPTRPS